MSLNQDGFRVSGQPHTSETLDKHTGSNNVWKVNRSDSDSRSDFAGRFWKRVERRGDGECWPWLGAKMSSGRGQVHIRFEGTKNIRRYAPVVAWELTHRCRVPAGCVVAHSCDNPNCVNPSHLSALPQGENVRDSIRKGRYNAWGVQKLNAAQVLEIRDRGARGEGQRSLAAAFSIARGTVSQILNHKTWAHLSAPVLANVERVPTVELPIYELRDLLQAPRQFRQPSQSVGVHARKSAVPQPFSSMTLKVITPKGPQSW